MKGEEMKKLVLIAAARAAAPVAANAQTTPAPAADPAAIDYSADSSWLCLPGRQDACGRPLPTADLNPNDYGPVSQAAPAADPPIDCFYVYPTVSRDPGMNSDMNAGQEEQTVAFVQFARFSTICRPFAPIHRQATLASIPAVLGGADPLPLWNTAYGDVLAAWRYYLAHHNHGRPFVLIGHSQGTIHLIRLIAAEIEGKPEAQLMLSALLLGLNVEVPEGGVVGGTFRSTPLCTSTGQTGCVITYVSFRAEAPPPEGALFGRAPRPGMTVGCTNPAALGGTASAGLDSYWFALSTQTSIAWSSAGAPPAPFLHTAGLATGACVHRGPLGYLAISVNADPADARTDRIPGDVSIAGQPQPGWGLHLVDVNLTMGNLLQVVAAQRDAWLRSHRN
jgi:hypothetical protein